MDARFIFADSRTALGVSYAMNTRPAQVPCSIRQALVTMMQGTTLTNARQRAWYARLIGTPSRTVNFAGLSPVERHAQCALIRLTVIKHLDPPQASAIMMAFSHTPHDRDAGLRGLVTHLTKHLRVCRDPHVLRELIERRYSPATRDSGHSYRAISERVCISKSHLARIARDIDRECTALEAEAMNALEQRFSNQGVCDPIIRLT